MNWREIMPHVILEYSENLDFDVQEFFRELFDSLVETGNINLKGLRGRALKLTEYRIADGKPDYKMAHVMMTIREGRPLEVKEEFAKRIMAQLEKTFGDHLEHGYIGLSNDMRELKDGIALRTSTITPEVVAMDLLA